MTIDHQSLEDGTVTIRERDSMEQRRIKVDEIIF
ncbi:MAG: His/Gly/Thr/Pro-type tRNA ligase C-terminal domain-containing protein [bacterium]